MTRKKRSPGPGPREELLRWPGEHDSEFANLVNAALAEAEQRGAETERARWEAAVGSMTGGPWFTELLRRMTKEGSR